MKIAIMGTGGVGGYFGGLLARDGHDVTFIARGAHLAAIQRNGLRVESGNDGTFTVPGNATADPATAGIQELVLFTVKMYDNDDAIRLISTMVGADTIILTLQNGIDNGDRLTSVYGNQRVMIGSAYMEGRISEPGVVTPRRPRRSVFWRTYTRYYAARGKPLVCISTCGLAGGLAGEHDRYALEKVRIPVRLGRRCVLPAAVPTANCGPCQRHAP